MENIPTVKELITVAAISMAVAYTLLLITGSEVAGICGAFLTGMGCSIAANKRLNELGDNK